MTADRWPDLAGRMEADGRGRYHVLPVRVYFEDTDFSGVVYHASYIRWCERGRTDFLRHSGNDHRSLLEGADGREAAAFMVRRMQIEFLKPARIDEILEVQTRIGEVGAATLELHQAIVRGPATLFEAKVLVVLVSTAGKPLRIGPRLRASLA